MSHRYRIHGVDVVSASLVRAWQAVATVTHPWALELRMPSPELALSVPPTCGRPAWTWCDTNGVLLLDITGTPLGGPADVAAASRYRVDSNHRRITVEYTHDLPEGCLDIVARWLLPDIARTERDLLPLHACAVLTEVGALLVLGDSGSGKSTLATGMLSAGATLIGDEPLCVGPTVVWPGPRLLRGDQDLMRSLLGVAPAVDSAGKAVLSATVDLEAELPLGALILLGSRRDHGDLVEVQRLPGPEASMRLMRLRYARPDLRVPEDFRRAAAVVAATPVFEVTLRNGLDQILPAGQHVLEHIRAST